MKAYSYRRRAREEALTDYVLNTYALGEGTDISAHFLSSVSAGFSHCQTQHGRSHRRECSCLTIKFLKTQSKEQKGIEWIKKGKKRISCNHFVKLSTEDRTLQCTLQHLQFTMFKPSSKCHSISGDITTVLLTPVILNELLTFISPHHIQSFAN